MSPFCHDNPSADRRLGEVKAQIPTPPLRRTQYERPRAQGVGEAVCGLARLNGGFSLLELMASVAILMVIMAAIFSVISYYQKTYGTTALKADMYENVRGVIELMAQEIGQAGLVNLPPPPSSPTLSAAVIASGTAQAVNVSSTTSMFVGEKLLVGTGASEELVSVTALNTAANQMTGVFTKAHASGAPINVLGVFHNGVMASSTGTQLRLFGDINADGSLLYVHYDCDNSTTPGTLTRSVTTVTPSVSSSSAGQTLLSTLIANPGGTPCFQYTAQLPTSAQTLGTGNGALTTFSGTVTPAPFSSGSLAVVAGSVFGLDNGSGSIVGTGVLSGTVNYTTGAVSVTFGAAPANGTAVQVGQSYITNVAVTLSVRTTQVDPQTKAYLTMTKSFLNLTPRNILAGLELANVPFTDRLQPRPPNLPLP